MSTPNSSKLTTSLLKNTLDAMPDGILIVSARREMIYTNQRFREIWRIPLDSTLTSEPESILEYAIAQVENPTTFIAKVEQLNNSDESFEDEIQLRDKRVLRRRSTAFNDDAVGRARIWIFSDITELKEAELDTLSGLRNRNNYQKSFLAHDIEPSANAPVGIVIIDFDHFKEFNDQFGHIAGDKAIQMFGETIQNFLNRESDLAYRIGGDEFLLLIRGRNQHNLQMFLQEFFNHYEQMRQGANPNHPIAPSISMGVLICRKKCTSKEAFKRADETLYDAKNSGGKRISSSVLE
jgi:diguanylate cyclase (GGDEF)-like protein